MLDNKASQKAHSPIFTVGCQGQKSFSERDDGVLSFFAKGSAQRHNFGSEKTDLSKMEHFLTYAHQIAQAVEQARSHIAVPVVVVERIGR